MADSAPLVVWSEGTEDVQARPDVVAWVHDRGAELALRPDLAHCEHIGLALRVTYTAGQVLVENI